MSLATDTDTLLQQSVTGVYACSRIRKCRQLCPERFLAHFPTGGLCRRINYNCAVFNPRLNDGLNLEYGSSLDPFNHTTNSRLNKTN